LLLGLSTGTYAKKMMIVDTFFIEYPEIIDTSFHSISRNTILLTIYGFKEFIKTFKISENYLNEFKSKLQYTFGN
jgi:hypothetical protein